MKKVRDVTQEFVKNSIRILKIQRNQENNIRSVLESYQTISTMMGPEEDMGKVFDGLESIKHLIEKISIDTLYNLRTVSSIEDNFEKYFQESRYPSEQQKRDFQNYVTEKLVAMEVELELMQDFQKQIRLAKSSLAV